MVPHDRCICDRVVNVYTKDSSFYSPAPGGLLKDFFEQETVMITLTITLARENEWKQNSPEDARDK